MTDGERITKVEVRLDEHDKEIERFRNHISNLLTFMNKINGGLLLIGFVGVTNIILLYKAFSR